MRKSIEKYKLIRKNKETKEILEEIKEINDEINIDNEKFVNMVKIQYIEGYKILNKNSEDLSAVKELCMRLKDKEILNNYEYISEDEYEELYNEYLKKLEEERARREAEEAEENIE